MATTEAARAASLVDAEQKAIQLFNEIERTLIRPGVSEKTLSDEIHALGVERFNVRTHWHKRLIRSGPNTLRPFDDNPADRIIEEDDILVVDLGPVFEEWEADFGRTYVLGNDPRKIRLRDALEPIWFQVKDWYYRQQSTKSEDEGVTGEELYGYACETAEKAGFKFGAPIAGHIVGSFPHERIPRDKITLYIAKGNNQAMARPGKGGHLRHWILEIHLHDPEGGFGGFMEQILTAGY